MVDDWVIKTMYATKRRRRTVKSAKAPSKDPPKSNPSKRHRERLNSELDHLASLLPFEQSVISKLDKLSILRLGVSYLRTKTYFQTVIPERYNIDTHLMTCSHLFHEPGFSEGESILQALYGFLFVVTCDGEVFFASRTVEQYLGFHQSDIIHQSVMELIHSEDREEFKRQLLWNSSLPQDKASLSVHEVLLPENRHYLRRSFTVRFRCLLDNTSGFITLEISGWIRVLHGQCVKSDEPALSLFATCCPFGPLSLLDLPSRELTFKSKHKMDLSPLSTDSRGKMMFGFSDRELSVKSGYDLIHPEDLSYYAAAHQELIKTGSSGLIAYRWQTKDLRWVWLQSSCKVVYKNSKPDFVIGTHRQLTDDEGEDLVVKRGNEFKLPYPLLDLDMCSGFGFSDDEITSKIKTIKPKKQKNQSRDYLQSGRKKKGSYKEAFPVLNGYNAYPFNGYGSCENSDLKSDLIYPYPGSNNFGLESEFYRPHAYSAFHGSVYPSSESYRFDADKHGYSNNYYMDHRSYQHPLPYPTNGYADLVAQSSKYGYEMAKYGLDSYADLTKKIHYEDDLPPRYDTDYRKFGYDCVANRISSRLNGTYEAVDLRSSSAYNSVPYANGVDNAGVSSSCLSSGSIHRSEISPEQNLVTTDSKIMRLSAESSQEPKLSIPLTHSSVIITNSNNIQHAQASSRMSSAELQPSIVGSTNGYSSQNRANIICSNSNTPTAPWMSCIKSSQNILKNSPTSSSPRNDAMCTENVRTDKTNCAVTPASVMPLQNSSPMSASTPASVIQLAHKAIHNRTCNNPSTMNSIPVPVVKAASWYNQLSGTHSSYNDAKEWHLPSEPYSYTEKTHKLISDNFINTPKHLSMKSGSDRGNNPLLSFTEVTQTLLSSNQ